MTVFTNIKKFFKDRDINLWIVFLFLVYVVFVIKAVNLKHFNDNIFFGIYSIAVSFYILSRFALSYLYVPQHTTFDPNFNPTLSFAVPSKNEGENIRETILRIADSDYPKDKFDIIAINDGSTDNTLAEMLAAKEIAKEKFGVEVVVIDWKINKGKREGMAECVRLSNKDLLVFIDSDSFVVKDTAREMIKYFTDPKIGAVAGQAYVANADKNMLTKMQSVRYFVAFKAYKAAEALFGSVTCCSGCCSAYRRAYILPVLDAWLGQTFLGVKCTYGDDRSLTNYLLERGYTAVFSPTSITYTFVPEKVKQYMRQQLRWKKSWLRENFRASLFIWKRNPIMSISFYLGYLLPIVAPVVLLRAVIWYPLTTHQFPWFYFGGLSVMAIIYGLYYFIHMRDRQWLYGTLFSTVYALLLVWQLPYALLTIRDPKWGTR